MPANVLVFGSYLAALVMEVERLPLPGETVLGRSFRQTHGGKGSNMAVQAARLGAKVEYTGVVGNDAIGEVFRHDLALEGVGLAGLRSSKGTSTGRGFILVDTSGRNQIAIDPGANAEFQPEADIERILPLLTGSGVALAQCEIPLPMALAGLVAARARGWQTILNPAPAVDLRNHDLSMVDFITPNETEARICLGLTPDASASEAELANAFLAQGVGAVVFTKGDRGARLVGRDRVLNQPAFPVDVCDTVGAGDSFNAALAVGLAEGVCEKDALRFACAAASLSTTRRDTLPSYHTRAEVDAYLAKIPC